MKCPHCEQDLLLHGAVYGNVATYGTPVVAVARCCGKGVVVDRVISYVVEPYSGDNKEDDWGNPILPAKFS